MKKALKLSLLALAVSATVACKPSEQQAQQPAGDAAQPAQEQAASSALQTDLQKQAYALGASVGSFIGRNLAEHDHLGINLDRDLVHKGFNDGLNNGSELSEQEIQALLQALDQQLSQVRSEQAESKAAEALEANTAFLTENAKKEGVITTESGLQYEVVAAGEGDKPVATDIVKVHYTGTLIDGTKFDSSVDRGEPATFPLNRVIPGWTEGVQLMSVGAKYRFYIPSDLGYGPAGAGTIPPNSALIFDVELLGIESSEPAAQ